MMLAVARETPRHATRLHWCTRPTIAPRNRCSPHLGAELLEWLSAQTPWVASRRAGTWRSLAAGVRSTVRAIYIREEIAASWIERNRPICARSARPHWFTQSDARIMTSELHRANRKLT